MYTKLKNIVSSIPQDIDNILFAIKHCLQISKIYYPVLVLVRLINIIKAYIVLYISRNIMNIITDIIMQKQSYMNNLYKWLLILFIMSMITTAIDIAILMYSRSISFKTNRFNSKKIYDKISQLDIAFYDDPPSLDKMKQVSQDSSSLDAIFNNILDIFGSIVSISISLYIAITFSPLLALLSIVFVIPSFINQRKIKKDEYELEKSINLLERKTGYFGSILTSSYYAKEIRINNLKNTILNYFDESDKIKEKEYKKLWKKHTKRRVTESLYSPVMDIITKLIMIKTVIFKNLTIGDYTYIVGIIGNLQGGIRSIASSYNNILHYRDRIKNYRDFMNIEPEIKNEGTLIPSKINEIEFRNITFKYPHSDKYALKNVSFKIRLGDKVALVGENGCGKTTIIKLLLRLYQPEDGSILLNGIDIKNYDINEYRKLFSPIFQDYCHYVMSIRKNVAFSDVDRINDDEGIIDVLGKMSLDNAIQKYESGIDTELTKDFDENGMLLSGGQMQRLSIARTIFKDASIFILDEPMASVDAKAEDEIFNLLVNNYKDKILILVSHRLGNLKKMNNIIVIKDGELLQQGTHSTLLAEVPYYNQLYNIQASKYIS